MQQAAAKHHFQLDLLRESKIEMAVLHKEPVTLLHLRLFVKQNAACKLQQSEHSRHDLSVSAQSHLL